MAAAAAAAAASRVTVCPIEFSTVDYSAIRLVHVKRVERVNEHGKTVWVQEFPSRLVKASAKSDILTDGKSKSYALVPRGSAAKGRILMNMDTESGNARVVHVDPKEYSCMTTLTVAPSTENRERLARRMRQIKNVPTPKSKERTFETGLRILETYKGPNVLSRKGAGRGGGGTKGADASAPEHAVSAKDDDGDDEDEEDGKKKKRRGEDAEDGVGDDEDISDKENDDPESEAEEEKPKKKRKRRKRPPNPKSAKIPKLASLDYQDSETREDVMASLLGHESEETDADDDDSDDHDGDSGESSADEATTEPLAPAAAAATCSKSKTQRS